MSELAISHNCGPTSLAAGPMKQNGYRCDEQIDQAKFTSVVSISTESMKNEEIASQGGMSLPNKTPGKTSFSSTASIDTMYQANLRKNERPRSKSSSIFVETPSGNGEQFTQESRVSVQSHRRSQRAHQKLFRYKTMPIKFEDISEIDEDLYVKDNPKSEQISARHDLPISNLRRRRSFGGAESTRHHDYSGTSRLCFESKYTKARSHSAGAILLPSTSNSQKPHWTMQRSHESLLQFGVSNLPTIPEELKSQYQQTLITSPEDTNQSIL